MRKHGSLLNFALGSLVLVLSTSCVAELACGEVCDQSYENCLRQEGDEENNSCATLHADCLRECDVNNL